MTDAIGVTTIVLVGDTERRSTQLIGLGAFVESSESFWHFLMDDMRCFYAYILSLHMEDNTVPLERTGRGWWDAYGAWKAHMVLMALEAEDNVIDIARES